MRLPSSSIVRILKSMPMVVMKDGVKESSLKRSRQHDFPTPESPMRSSLICGPQRCKSQSWERQQVDRLGGAGELDSGLVGRD